MHSIMTPDGVMNSHGRVMNSHELTWAIANLEIDRLQATSTRRCDYTRIRRGHHARGGRSRD